MKNKSMNVYVADELSNKVRCLSMALSQAKDIISKLENENNRLKDVLIGLASSENMGHILHSEAFDESVCAA